MSEEQLIDVEVSLKDGRTHTGVLPANSPILESLFAGLVAGHDPGFGSDAQAPVTLIQFPIHEGTAACSFLSNSIISVITSPPVLINPVHQNRPAATEPVAQSAAPLAAGQARPAYVQIEDFLTPDENARVLAYALENEAAFSGSTVLDEKGNAVAGDFRKSRVLDTIQSSPWHKVFEQRLRLHLTHLAPTLGLDADALALNELQLTASNDGDFFKAHADSSHVNEKVAARQLTVVYYFHADPKPYVGGDLVIYDGHNGANRPHALPPRNNCLVAFPSAALHEVDLVKCPSRAFGDSRFTINGWLGARPSRVA